MFCWSGNEPEDIAIGLLLGSLIGAFCGGIPLTVGLIRNHKTMAWTGFGFCILVGAGCMPIALVPALIFTLIVAITEPIDGRKKKKKKKKRRRRERADDFVDDDYQERQRTRRRDDDDEDEDRPRRRRRDEDDDDEDRPRRRRRRDDD